MNNPEANFMSPMSGGPPAGKKLRGGATPRPFASASASSRSRGVQGSGVQGESSVSTSTSMGPPSNRAGQPPVPPPATVRGTVLGAAEVDPLATEASEGVARRKAELRRMQEQRERVTQQRAMLRANEFASLQGPKKEPTVTVTGTTTSSSSLTMTTSVATIIGGPSFPPMQPAGVEHRVSDLFPTVPKSPSPAVGRNVATILPNTAIAATTLPDIDAAAATTVAVTTVGPTTIPGTTRPAETIPTTPAVNRKLEFPSSRTAKVITGTDRKARSKSVPARPPPPPPPPPPQKETEATNKTSKKNSSPKTKSSTSRPAAVDGATLDQSKDGTLKSAMYGPPPPTNTSVDRSTAPPPVNIPFSRTADRAATKKKSSHYLDNGPSSPHLVQSSKTVPAMPPPTVPPTLKEGAEMSSEDTKKDVMPNSGPPVVPMMAVKGTLPQNTLPYETPVPPSLDEVGGIPDTPPSSGSSTRREKIKVLRAAAGEAAAMSMESSRTQGKEASSDDAGPPPLVSETQRRLEEAYAKAEREKLEALKRVKELEEKLAKSLSLLKQSYADGDDDGPSALALEHLLRLADEEGPHAAVEWAKTTRTVSSFSFSTPMMKGGAAGVFPMSMAMESPIRRRVANRAVTPAPKRTLGKGDGATSTKLSAAEIEKQLIKFFKDAAQTIPFEYTSDLATYCIRRPYGLETAPELFGLVSPTSHGDYSKRAHVSTLSTIEVAVTILADHSLLLLYDVAGVRYKTNPNAREWKVVSNVDDSDRPLGHVMYIDEQANECEYCLDSIFEEALLVRQHYCSTLTSMALSLEQRPPAPVAAPSVTVELKHPGGIPESVQFSGTSGNDDKASPPPAAETEIKKGVQGAAPAEEKLAQQAPGSVDPAASGSSSGSADVLIVFISMLFSTVAGLIYFLLIGLPLRIIQTTFILVAVYGIISFLYMYAAQDYNDWMLQNMHGSITGNHLVFFSNHRPGIM